MADEDLNFLSEQLGTASEDILAIGPAGPTARQIRFCQRLNAEMGFQDNGVIRAILTEEGLEKYANEDSILFLKIKGKKKKKKSDYLEKFLEDMEKFLKEIRQAYIHTLAVSAYRREVKGNMLEILDELGALEKTAMMPHVKRYKGELDTIKQKIHKYREELKAQPSAQRVKEIQDKLHVRTEQIESIGTRFKKRLQNLMRRNVAPVEHYDPYEEDQEQPDPQNLHSKMNRAAGTMGSEIGNAYADQNHGPSLSMMSASTADDDDDDESVRKKLFSRKPASGKPHSPAASWVAAAGGEAGTPSPS